MADVVILVNGVEALTTKQLADRLGYDAATLRSLLRRLDVEPADQIDGRTPVYIEADVRKELKEKMLGRGWHR